jgi:hypothetical protein
LALLRAFAEDHDGTVVAQLGDEIMCSFDDAADAAAAACEMHAMVAERYPRDESAPPVRLKIGAHCGLVEADDEFTSETTRIAHWATGNAKPEQTLGTQAFVDGLPRIYKALSRYVDDETWDFVSVRHLALYEIIWDVESVTACSAEQPPSQRETYSSVRFRFGRKFVVLDEQRPVISVGRALANDLVVNHDLVSRQHFSAQFSRGRCTITDNSTNGSLLIPDGGERQQIKRETLPLTGAGLIIVGRPPTIDEGLAIHYECG